MIRLSRPADRLPLWPADPPASSPGDSFRPWLERYPAQGDTPRGAVLICPGGGYANRAPHEGEPVARRFNQAGLHAFVVQYRVAPHRHPAPLLDASRAVRIIRANAAIWQVDADHIGILGFSAGGHLAASLGVHFADPVLDTGDALATIPCRPDALILCYPVISSGAHSHAGSFDNLLGEDAPDSLRVKMSAELQVSASTPPAFLWHTFEDAGVPVENSLLFGQALRRFGTPFELHVYPHGKHGLGLAPEDPHVATWMDLCCGWLKGMGWMAEQ